MKLYIISGEGEVGTRERYTGKRTVRAVKARLTRERAGGDRWAHLEDEHGEHVTMTEVHWAVNGGNLE